MVFLVLLVPVLVMVFALLMERLEHHLQATTVSEQDVEEFFDMAQPDEVNTLIREGWSRALSMFRLRRRKHRPPLRSGRPSDPGRAATTPHRDPQPPGI